MEKTLFVKRFHKPGMRVKVETEGKDFPWSNEKANLIIRLSSLKTRNLQALTVYPGSPRKFGTPLKSLLKEAIHDTEREVG